MNPKYNFLNGKGGSSPPQKGKTRISIYVDETVLHEFQARADKSGTKYPSLMNEALRSFLAKQSKS